MDLKEAELKKTADKARAEAELVFETEVANKTLALNVAQQNAEIAAEERRIELAAKRVAVTERELEATVKKQAEADRYAAEQAADADLYAKTKEADATKIAAAAEAEKIKVEATAEAERIKSIGEAEGQAEESKGKGIAAGMQQQIEAYNSAQNGTFLADRYLAIMPQAIEAAAMPIAAVDSIKMYGQGNSAALVSETTKVMDQVNSSLADSIGIDLHDIVANVVAGSAAGSSAGRALSATSDTLPQN